MEYILKVSRSDNSMQTIICLDTQLETILTTHFIPPITKYEFNMLLKFKVIHTSTFNFELSEYIDVRNMK